ncbi:hypothetical protein [Tabrizicola sp. BL-A-41-H6]|uniref:hypothetical protein n=1 Tax=Tabrizicola sp. BL-A-41-H6 TaxID=3421107 RepID=UPI003D66A442
MSETNETVITHHTFGRRKGIVRWHEPLAAAFPTEAERTAIVALFDDAMRSFDTVVFYVHYTMFENKEIEWASTVDDATDEIEIDATLATRFNHNADGEIELSDELLEYLLWYEAKYYLGGAPLPATLEEAGEVFRLWKKAKEDRT